ncbi:MAG TPA: LysM domain-containing protein [Chthoniobacterales bacterium]|jgi:LysM repeat protein|nr:LysM domain-containing protein [Chthoniobacterales bacterium]
MKLLAGGILCALAVAAFTISTASAQTFASTPNPAASETAQLQELTKKIEEQNAKIDMLSQQILKLQQQLGEHKPGVMIGEATSPSPAGSTIAKSTSTPVSSTSASPDDGNTHVVARGETLTSIAHQHNVSVSDLQKFNHIENPLKLQAGQTLQIPPSPVPSPSSSGE